MKRVRNADEFLRRFREIGDAYNSVFGPRLLQIRETYVEPLVKHAVDQSLEAHARQYIVNAVLASLNWRLGKSVEEGLPNLVPEAPIRSTEAGTIRFLDYLGIERQTDDPLLVVETKRRSASLPRSSTPTRTHSDTISVGLLGQQLFGEWNEWLLTLRDYVRSIYERVSKVPKRVILTNSDWWIIFLDPSDAFLETGRCDPNLILVFVDASDVEMHFGEMFLRLDYQQVSHLAPALTLGELNFQITPAEIECVLHGLRLFYIKQEGIYRPSPVVKVAPMILIRSRLGAWLRIESPPKDYAIPHDPLHLLNHLQEVSEAASELLKEVNRRLNSNFTPLSLSQHYQREDGFDALPGITESTADSFMILTGDKAHYLLPEPSVLNCPYHEWSKANDDGCPSTPAPVMTRSILPRSFFTSGELHHCAHRDVATAKAAPITSLNRLRCGLRSGQDGQAFCEIWRFENHLCCRTCAFEEVCTKADIFKLPCQHKIDAT